MRAAMSGRLSNTTARASVSNSEGSAAARLRIAPRGASEPNSETSPPTGEIGLSSGRITAGSAKPASSRASRAPSVSPAMVGVSRWSSGLSRRSTAPIAPAAWKSSM